MVRVKTLFFSSVLILLVQLCFVPSSSFSNPICNSYSTDSPSRLNVDTLLDTINPFAIFLRHIFGVPHTRLIPNNFFEYTGTGSIVGINGITKKEIYFEAADYMTGKPFVDDQHVFQQRVESADHFIETLLDIYKKSGPISKLVIAAHGIPGSMSIGGKSMGASYGLSLVGDEEIPDDLFSPDATVVLISCTVAQKSIIGDAETTGPQAIRNIFSGLLKQGGVVIASTRYVDPELSKIPAEYKSIQERFRRHLVGLPLSLVFESLLWAFSDWKSKTTKIVRVEIPVITRH